MRHGNRRPIVGVMGGGSVPRKVLDDAYRLGALIAENGWILLNGGRNSGVMDASARGAHESGGLTIGILPDVDPSHVSDYIDIPVVTGMGNARNSINILSSDVVVACQGGAGTLSEISLAIKTGKPVVLLDYPDRNFLSTYAPPGRIYHAVSPEAAVDIIASLL